MSWSKIMPRFSNADCDGGRLYFYTQWFIIICAIAWSLRWNNSNTSVSQEKILRDNFGEHTFALWHFIPCEHLWLIHCQNVRWEWIYAPPPHLSFEVWSGQQDASDRLIFNLPCSAETEGVHPSSTVLPHSWYHFPCVVAMWRTSEMMCGNCQHVCSLHLQGNRIRERESGRD
jgi:hypothetical protein